MCGINGVVGLNNISEILFQGMRNLEYRGYDSCGIALMKKKGIFHISGPETFSIYDLVLRVAKFCGLETESLNKTTSESLNQAAKRPPKTGFDLTKARKEIGYNPMSFEESLKLLF